MMIKKPLFSAHTTSPQEMANTLKLIEELRDALGKALSEISIELEDKIDELDKNLIEKIDGANNAINQLNQSLLETNQSLGQTNAALSSAINDLNQTINNKDKAVRDKIDEDIETLKQELNVSLSNLTENIGSVSQTLNSHIQSTSNNFDSVNSTVSKNKQDIETKHSEYVASNDARITLLSNSINESLGSLSQSLDTTAEDILQTISDLNTHFTSELDKTNLRITDLASDIRKEMGLGNTTLAESISSLDIKLTNYIQSNDKSVGDLEKSFNDYKLATNNSFGTVNSSINQINTNINSIGGRVSDLETTTANQGQSIGQISTTLANWMARTDNPHKVTAAQVNAYTKNEVNTNFVSINDGRLTNEREWSESTVSETEARGGVSKQRRAWTSERVRNAIEEVVKDYLGKNGGIVEDGNIVFNKTLNGIGWNMNTDGAGVRFKNDGDSDPDSFLEFFTRDNGNEYFRWSHYLSGGQWATNTNAAEEWMTLQRSGLDLRRGKYKGDGGDLINLPSSSLVGNIPTALLPVTATRWPTVSEVGAAAASHQHPWGNITGAPVTATRWPSLAEVTGKPTHYPTSWGNVDAKPATATRWPTFAEVTGRPSIYASNWANVADKPATATRWPTVAEIGAAPANHEHQHVPIPDNRGAVRAPSFFPRRAVRWDFIESANTGAGGDGWHVLMTVSPWTSYNDTHRQQQLIFTGAGGLKFRHATSDSAWGALRTILDSGNFSSIAPATATRWPTLAEVTSKPTHYPTTWDSVASKPATATRWPTASEVGLGSVPNVDTRNAANISSGVLNRHRIPAAPNSATAGQGFGGFRYTFSNGILNLYTT